MAKLAGFFPIGDTGEQFVVAEWHPDPELIEAEMIKMASDFADWETPLEEVRQLMIENTRLLFEEERGPDGEKWVPLDPVYAIDKAKAGFADKTILRREDDLYDAATSEEAWLISDNAVFFDSGSLPDYGMAHQDGTGVPGTTRFHRIMRTADLTGGVFEPEEARFISGHPGPIGAGRGKSLPARPFIGATRASIYAIETIFLDHLETTVTEAWEEYGVEDIADIGMGGGLGFGTNIHGTFPIISITKHGVPILRTPHGPRFGRKPR